MPSATRWRRVRRSSRLRSVWGSSALLTALGGGVVLVVLLLAWILPALDSSRRIATEVPQPPPLQSVSLVEIPGGQQACSDQIGLLPGAQVAQMRIGTYGKAPAPLLFALTGPDYRQTIPVAPSYVDNGLLEIAFKGSAQALEGSVCLTNLGRTPVALYAAAGRGESRSSTTVDGHLWPANFDLAFYAAKRQSLLDDAGTIMRRLRLFHAHVGLGLLWVLALLLVIGVPLAAVATLTSASRTRP
ncbi:MAG TPA: hypothetical protein VK721_01625 [Solirubrobacteraceae bacterium]|jgi:hypothetical protein|nr:hypothetical protein [Solirubrobacteraceae bacterium]